ncbi:uncharacterized protein C9orf85 homolog [Biomphalaria glabrata]|uniref:Uncharacterized protein C9orf85 homolog n=3 Tax=Biomphalaria TaxID=6525 RepID=A0A9W2ZQD2_BIOGL|nr:uncharacterized protein C9orf85 homolog [Biomphalaria glabrata]XP_055877073.1 uncharacterized protein C9orf85 homolog [Biomphalaria glabrata]XP_055877077.1 uncharacterized protein C9orf85 homolog [Biomphalaria glabrata]XP_055877083.1 uncharacterized protein C9orf85 homolog [Biomphalaria glabrata]XP_055877088.1 uncharacterized protein C9orf85 homolog [Biomphalaria glabrata]XP_055877095.1 uncharacterized protein C9orf85 homolog [Biomphalaria glabrata]XP_055877102.1 uncharacterized protein C9
MSTQRGNVSRTRKQKFQNSRAFKNDMHDNSQKTKLINTITPVGLCQRCKEIIEWKIKYKKYKPLSQPATCIRCHGKTVKRAYYTVCKPCATEAQVCAKCNTKQEIVVQPGPSEQEKMIQDGQLKFELQQLKERQRRAFFRHLEKGENPTEALSAAGACAEDSSDEEFNDSDENCDLDSNSET